MGKLVFKNGTSLDISKDVKTFDDHIKGYSFQHCYMPYTKEELEAEYLKYFDTTEEPMALSQWMLSKGFVEL